MLPGTAACTPQPVPDTETTLPDTTIAEQTTEAVTDPPVPAVDRTKPQADPFGSTTELSFERQIGLRTGIWPNCKMVTTPVDFSRGCAVVRRG